jgi:hypothetical protein
MPERKEDQLPAAFTGIMKCECSTQSKQQRLRMRLLSEDSRKCTLDTLLS